jgi:hypothetical protein
MFIYFPSKYLHIPTADRLGICRYFCSKYMHIHADGKLFYGGVIANQRGPQAKVNTATVASSSHRRRIAVALPSHQGRSQSAGYLPTSSESMK